MLVLKLMHDDRGFSDDHFLANFSLIQIPDHVQFKIVSLTVPEGQIGNNRGESFAVELYNSITGETALHNLTGNLYVMNESGKTIASHGC